MKTAVELKRKLYPDEYGWIKDEMIEEVMKGYEAEWDLFKINSNLTNAQKIYELAVAKLANMAGK
eukprot:4198504-Karenia_brevis.AAC.1